MVFVSFAATTARAFIEPAGNRLADFDGRMAKRGEPASVSEEQQVELIALRKQLPELQVDFDSLTGAPRLVSARDGFLTGSNGPASVAPAGALAALAPSDPDGPAKLFLREHRGLFGHGPEALDQARVVRAYTTPHNGMRTVVWQQEVDRIPVLEAVLVAHATKRGELINISSGFVPDAVVAANAGTSNRAALVASPPLTAAAAVLAAARNVGESLTEGEVEPVAGGIGGAEQQQKFLAQPLRGEATTSLVWVPVSRQEFQLCWQVILTSRLRGEMFRVFVDAQNGEVLLRRCLTRYLSDASYRVYTSDSPSPFSPGHATALSTQPAFTNRVLLTLPAFDTNASPDGWISDGINETTGNNVDAHTDRDDNDLPDLPRPAGSPSRVFDFAMDPVTQDPTNYMSAAVVQLFYLCNLYHDKLYELGFTEGAGNFQINNFGRGGLGGDPVLADAQDGGGVNNANFSTPPDGSPGRMQMYIFSGPSPRRDGDFDTEIVFHEFTHGLSWRLVGGGQGLGTSQSDGMGEGWSDFYGLSLLSEPGDDVNGCYAAGGYATYLLSGLTANYYYGIRRYPYSTDMTKNPLTFKDIDTGLASPHTGIPRSPIIGTTPSEVHNQGEVWCAVLWEARANLVNKYGWAVGNQLILQLVTDGMKLTPASPNFLQARDGILQADLVDTGGANRNELWAAFAKRGMGYSATSPASTSNSGIGEAYDVPDNLFIVPTLVLAAGGTVGGPFSPNPASFILTNTGGSTLNWSLANTSSWINVAPSSGVLLSGGPSVNYNVSILPAANRCPLGTYTPRLSFTNQTTGVVQGRTFELSVAGLYMADDFDPDLDLSQWSSFGGTVGSTVLAINYGGFISSPNSLWFGDAGSRFATTIPIDTRGGGNISFAVRLAEGTSSTWETADSLPGEGVVLEGSTNGGASWTLLGSYDTAAYYNWTAESLPIPAAAQSAATRFRWRQKSHSGNGYDHWALEDVSINAVPAQYLGLSLPSNTVEGVPFVMGTVTATPAPAVDTTIFLDSNDNSEIMPASPVVILAGQTNADVVLYVVDDGEFDGTQPVTITATSVGFQNGVGTMSIEDNEVATLSVSLPSSTTEGAGGVSGTVRLNVIPSADVVVGLSSSDLTEIQVPATVLIPNGQTSAVFTVTVPNDNLIDGAQAPTVTAHVANWIDGAGDITVLDDENVNLAVSLPASTYENVGVLTGAGSVAISGGLPTNLVVLLQSSDPTEATVAASATILAGQTNVAFDLTLVDDVLVDGAQAVRIAASAPGFNAASNTISVLDDESPPTPSNPVPLNLASNIAANTSLSWSNGAAGITNEVYFGTAPGGGQLVFQGSTLGTNWTLPLLSPNTTYYWRIISRRVGSTIGPIWRFTTRGLDHFEFNPIVSPEFVNQPFPVTITARDEFNSAVSNYTGTVSLTGWAGSNAVTLFADDFEDGNLAGWNIGAGSYVRSVTNDTAAGGSYSLSLSGGSSTHGDGVSQSFTNIAPASVTFHVRASATNVAGGYFVIGTNILSNDQIATWFYMRSDGTMGLQEDIGGWHGVPYAADQWYKISLQLDWTNKQVDFFVDDVLAFADLPFRGANLTGLTIAYLYNFNNTRAWWDEIVFGGGNLASPVILAPTNSGNFANGAWTGNITVQQLADRMYLRAADTLGHVATSADFAVVAINDLAMTLAAAPNPAVLGQPITNTVVVTNSGPAVATGVFVTNVLSAGAALVGATTTQGSYSIVGDQIVFNLGTLNGAVAATMTVVAAPLGGGALTNFATVVRGETDGYASNNTAQTVTLVNTPAMAIADAAKGEGNGGASDLLFNVSLLPAPFAPVTVDFATANGSAVAGTDYFATNGVLSFMAGQTNAVIAVRILGDTNIEPFETFSVLLSNATNCVVNKATGLGTIQDDDAPVVGVYDDPLYVDTTSGGTGAESDNVQATLTNLGFTSLTFTDITQAATNYQCLLFPELENGSLGAALTGVQRAALSNFVARGGTLIVHGTSGARTAALLNTVFNWALVEPGVSSTFVLTSQASGTQFADDPGSLPSPSATTALTTNSLPSGSRSIYEASAQSSVALISWGSGVVIFLGWDWYNAAPLGTQDGGWLAVLNSAVRQRALAPVSMVVPSGSALVADSCGGGNGVIDPNEPVTLRFGLRNVGNLATTNLVATLLPTGGVLSPSGPQTYGALLPGSAVSNTFSLVATGACGGTLVATLQLQDGTNNLGTVSYNFQLGVSAAALAQNFDAVTAPALPAGWTAALTGGGNLWTTTTAVRDSLPNAAFAPDPGSTSTNTLTSPTFSVPTNGGQLTFRHAYSTESCCDGGLLEISIGGGAFTDILAAGGSFVTNGYSSVSPASWRGISTGYPGFITTVANLPGSSFGQNIQLRWRFFADSSVAGAGWYVDNISLGGGFTCCVAPPVPVIILQPTDTNVYVGTDAGFTVMLTGWTPMYYQWMKDGVNLPAGTNQTLSLVGVTTNDAGGYSVVVTNAYGAVTSSKAYLTVVQPEIVNPASITIADASAASPYPSTITVAGLTGAVAKVTVALRGVNHSFPDDLDVLLVGPTGTNVLLMSDAGGHADLTGATLVFDDQAATDLPDADQIVSGTYRPTNFEPGDALPAPATAGDYGANLAVFNGTDPNGLWKLFVYDDEVGDAGSMSGGWSLRITTAGPGMPEFLPAQVVGGQIQLRFATSIGQSYTVQYKNSLADTNWASLQSLTGDGTVRTVLDPINSGNTRFYRLRMP